MLIPKQPSSSAFHTFLTRADAWALIGVKQPQLPKNTSFIWFQFPFIDDYSEISSLHKRIYIGEALSSFELLGPAIAKFRKENNVRFHLRMENLDHKHLTGTNSRFQFYPLSFGAKNA